MFEHAKGKTKSKRRNSDTRCKKQTNENGTDRKGERKGSQRMDVKKKWRSNKESYRDEMFEEDMLKSIDLEGIKLQLNSDVREVGQGEEIQAGDEVEERDGEKEKERDGDDVFKRDRKREEENN